MICIVIHIIYHPDIDSNVSEESCVSVYCASKSLHRDLWAVDWTHNHGDTFLRRCTHRNLYKLAIGRHEGINIVCLLLTLIISVTPSILLSITVLYCLCGDDNMCQHWHGVYVHNVCSVVLLQLCMYIFSLSMPSMHTRTDEHACMHTVHGFTHEHAC